MAGQILIVEDDADVAHVAEAFLKREGYLVEVARDGLEGLDAALAIEPDLIVLDSSPPFVAPDTSSNDAGSCLQTKREGIHGHVAQHAAVAAGHAKDVGHDAVYGDADRGQHRSGFRDP